MVLQIDDWIFDVDIKSTMEYSATEAAHHCVCAYCRNFYTAVDDTYPKLRPFLAQFGVEIEAPDELMPFDMADGMCYDSTYTVSGKIVTIGSKSIDLEGISISPEIDSEINHGMASPCFYLTVNDLVLPWVLDEPMEEVVSPANQPSFLKKMWNKLLKRQPSGWIES